MQRNLPFSFRILLSAICLCMFPTLAQASASLELYATIHAMGITVTVASTDDPDLDATASVQYRTGANPYASGFPLTRVSSTRFVGSLFWLKPGTSYDVRVTLTLMASRQKRPRT